MAMPIKTEPKKSAGTPPADLMHKPSASITMEYNKDLSNPIRADTRGMKVENREKQISGTAASQPIITGVSRSCSAISGITGPTDVTGARKLAAIKTIQTSAAAGPRVDCVFTAFAN